ncbi:WD40-repeat-containing domain protein [Epithele typhae]|uniref:WD40-repeat-containing domain protein n=1 Tax=Epithele typhae TaxID=378194 RepID=UPI00200799D9|nr:WD40-repeat-containing domain protein [Epithele typhae]KAH9909426.1 WD40-repeat-containing domain protein [Epithele typhae]
MPLLYQPLLRMAHPEGHSDAVIAVTFSQNGDLVASGGLDGRVCVWSVADGTLRYVFSGKSAILSLLWLDTSNDQMVCGMENGTIAFLSITSTIIKLDGFWAHDYPVERLAVKGNCMASGAHEQVKIWSRVGAHSWDEKALLDPPPRSACTTNQDVIVTSLHWTSSFDSPSLLLVTYMSHGIVLFDGRTGSRLHMMPVPGLIADAHLSPDHTLLAVSNLLNGFELFLVDKPGEIEPLFSVNQDVSARRPLPVRFLHKGTAFLGGTSQGKINIWSVYTRLKQTLSLPGKHTGSRYPAHYDNSTDSFVIVTGLFRLGVPCPIILWKAQEARTSAFHLQFILTLT